MSDRDGAPTMSQREYARHVGCDAALVNRWLRQGKIPRASDNRIDPVKADAARAGAADPVKEGVRRANAERKAAKNIQRAAKPAAAEQQSTAGAASPAAGNDGAAPGGPPSGPTFNQVQTARIGFAAKREELRFEQESGKLCDVDRVRAAVAEGASSARRILEQMPNRIASRLAAESDTRKIHQLLEVEIEAVCHEIAAAARTLSAPGAL